jgi:hypothetical protein
LTVRFLAFHELLLENWLRVTMRSFLLEPPTTPSASPCMVYHPGSNERGTRMNQKHAVFVQFAVILAAMWVASDGAQAFDQTKYPDWHGQSQKI